MGGAVMGWQEAAPGESKTGNYTGGSLLGDMVKDFSSAYLLN